VFIKYKSSYANKKYIFSCFPKNNLVILYLPKGFL